MAWLLFPCRSSQFAMGLRAVANSNVVYLLIHAHETALCTRVSSAACLHLIKLVFIVLEHHSAWWCGRDHGLIKTPLKHGRRDPLLFRLHSLIACISFSPQLASSPNTDVLRKFIQTTEIQSNLYIWNCCTLSGAIKECFHLIKYCHFLK